MRDLVMRLHNPFGKVCGCLEDCWCQRHAWGRVVRWWLPVKHHNSVPPGWSRDKSVAPN